ncbi:MAG: hypothetical protein MJ234_02260 [bacterium]|nr:hypothetical protein [bacterium]
MRKIFLLLMLACIALMPVIPAFSFEAPFLIAEESDDFLGKVSYKVDKNQIDIFIDYKGSDATELRAYLLKGEDRIASFRNVSVGDDAKKVKLSWADPSGNAISGSYTLLIRLYSHGDFYAKKKVNINVTGRLSVNGCKKDAGGNHIFSISYSNFEGKKITAELYDGNDRFIRGFNFIPKKHSGSFQCKWNGYPVKGAKCRSGNYSLKYWGEGVSPKTKRFVLELGEENEY